MIIDLFNYDRISKSLFSTIEANNYSINLVILAGELGQYFSTCSLSNPLLSAKKLDVLYILCPPIASKSYFKLLNSKLSKLSIYKPKRVVVYKPMLYSFPYDSQCHMIEKVVEDNFPQSGFKYFIKPGICFDSFIRPFLFMLSSKIYYDSVGNSRISFFILKDLVNMLLFLGTECEKTYKNIHLTGPTNYDLEEVSFVINRYFNTPFLYKNVELSDLKSIYMRYGYSYFYSSQFILLTLAIMNNQFSYVSEDYMYLTGKPPKNLTCGI